MYTNLSPSRKQFQEKEVRTIVREEDGAIAFCLSDLLKAQGSSTTTTAAKASVEEVFGDGYVIYIPTLDALGRDQNTAFVLEQAATYLIAQSRTKQGKFLNRWFHLEVLPQIRKTGSYTISEKAGKASKIENFAPSKWLSDHAEVAKKIQLLFDNEEAKNFFLSNLYLGFPNAGYEKFAEEKKQPLGEKTFVSILDLANKLSWFNDRGVPESTKVSNRLIDLGYLSRNELKSLVPTQKSLEEGICSTTEFDRIFIDRIWSSNLIPILQKG